MNIEIKTILIDEKKLTKSLFSQLPKILHPFEDDGKLIETILGYVNYNGDHLLIYKDDKLYRSAYELGESLYCDRAKYLRIKNSRQQEVKEGEACENILVSNIRFCTECVEFHIPHIAFGSFYVRTSQHDMPPGFACIRIYDPEDKIIEYNNKILNNLDQIFLKA